MHYITVDFYRNHEWFKKDLPGYLFPSPTGSDASFIDIDAVDEVCEVNCTHTQSTSHLFCKNTTLQKFTVTDKEVQHALLSGNPHDQLAIAYHLIVDNKRIEDETSKLDLKDLHITSSPPPFFDNNLPKPGRQRILSSGSSGPERQRTLSGNSDKNRSTPMKKAKWHLGIRSQSKPHDIMNEVYRAMKLLDFVSLMHFAQCYFVFVQMNLTCVIIFRSGK